MHLLAADAVRVVEVIQCRDELRAALLACDEFVVYVSGAIDMRNLSRDLIPNRLGTIMDVHPAYRANHSGIIITHRNHAPCISNVLLVMNILRRALAPASWRYVGMMVCAYMNTQQATNGIESFVACCLSGGVSVHLYGLVSRHIANLSHVEFDKPCLTIERSVHDLSVNLCNVHVLQCDNTR